VTSATVHPMPEPTPVVTRVERAATLVNARSGERRYVFRPTDLTAGVQLYYHGLSDPMAGYIVRGIYHHFRKSNRPADRYSQVAIQNVVDGTMRRVNAGYICSSARWSLLL
jgi:hypothetical protein